MISENENKDISSAENIIQNDNKNISESKNETICGGDSWPGNEQNHKKQ